MAAINPKREAEELISQQIQAFKNAATMEDGDILEYHLRHFRIMVLYREMDRIARTMQRTQGWMGPQT